MRARDEVAEARTATVAAETAHVNVTRGLAWTRTEPQPQGAIFRAAKSVLRRVGATSGEGSGVLDLRRRRYAIDWGNFAVVYENQRQWQGVPGGRRVGSGSPARPVPLWLIDMLAGVVDASDEEGTTGRHLRVVVDFERAADEIAGLYVPRASPALDPRAVAAEVWISQGLIDRVALAAESNKHSLALSRHGVSLDDFDWDSLPKLR
jgi:hypothetical protein